MEDQRPYLNRRISGIIMPDGEPSMTFGEALAALRDGRKVRRLQWKGHWSYERPMLIRSGSMVEGATLGKMMVTSIDSLKMAPMLVATLEDGRLVPAQPYQDDLLAEDWVIVEEVYPCDVVKTEGHKIAALFTGKTESQSYALDILKISKPVELGAFNEIRPFKDLKQMRGHRPQLIIITAQRYIEGDLNLSELPAWGRGSLAYPVWILDHDYSLQYETDTSNASSVGSPEAE